MLVATAATLEQVEKWRPFFAAGGAYLKDANETRVALSRLVENLDTLAMSGAAALAHEDVCGWPATEIEALSHALPAFRAPPTILNMFNLSAWLQRRNAQKILRTHNVATDRSTCATYAEAASFEHAVKRHARQLSELLAHFAISGQGVPPTRRDLLVAARATIDQLDEFRRFAERIDACPVQDVWNYLTRCVLANAPNGNTRATVSPTKPVLEPLIQGFETAVRMAATRLNSLDALDRLRPYLCEPTANDLNTAITGDRPTTLDHSSLQAALPHMVAYQTFRLRYALLSEAAKRSFAELHMLAPHIPALRPGDTIAAIMRREAACAWKDGIETTYPHLRQLQSELDERIAELDRLDGQMRHANRTLLSKVDRAALSPQSQWEKIWMLTGVNAKRLRQVFDSGRALGLLKMRPVWLVNPDVASRMLPLEPGLFDVVIFDEASQMRVVNAVPSLYRAKRCVISGDEKQLPPTTFFGSKSDEHDKSGVEDEQAFAAADNAEPEDDAEAQSNSIDPRELASSERHIKDCEDLLALARGLLPQASLDIHYRSEFRELIAFSNAAYYGGRLNVPIAKSAAAVIRAKPIEVRRVDGPYLNQTNPREADAVVDILAQLWAQRPSPPTVGIVTFNMKQAELIAARLDAKADQDREFGKALIRERTRTDKGEDVGFFVKNLENVQGDERDWIVFSTTFGRDEAGVFKRVFGALNQQGGERRLNVAVTRAKQKVMLVTSMPTAEISSFLGQRRAPTLARDYLQSYMRYAEMIDEGALDGAAHILGSFESAPRPDTGDAAEPDELVLQALLALQGAGFQAAAMPLNDAFSLEIAVTDPATSQYALGIEFDSPRHVLLRNARAREVWRPKLLAKSGMKLHRIVSSEWVRDPGSQTARLIEAAQNAIDGMRS